MNNIYPNSLIKGILEDSNTIAIVGASSNEGRDSYKVMKFLLERGYEVFPVNPNQYGKKILGQHFFTDLESIKKSVDIVDVFRAHDAIMDVAIEAVKIGAKVLWMQENIYHQEASDFAKNAGLKVIMDRCPKKELSKPYWTNKTK